MKKTFWLLLALLAVVACEERSLFESSLKFAEGETLTFNGIETKKLTVVHTPEGASLGEGNIKWNSTDKNVAWARRGGFVEAKGIGECDITAEAFVNDQLVRATCHVTVTESKMTSLVVDSAHCILIGDGVQLTASFEPANTTYANLIWSSSNDSIATVDQKGYVQSLRDGTCVISVTNANKSLEAKCSLTILPIKMTSLTLDKKTLKIEAEETEELKATIEPKEVTYAELYWSSSDENVAKVVDGKVEGVDEGTCVITVTNRDKSLKAECEVTVTVTKMTSLTLMETECEIALGRTHQLIATFEPTDATFNKLSWSSSDENVAKVENGKVKAVGEGTCTITVTNKDKSLAAECVVTVKIVEITTITCPAELKLEKGENKFLKATREPSNVSPICDTLYWESSDEKIAKVEKKTGKVTAVEEGECTITIGNIYNDVKATCRVTVSPVSVKKISLDKTSLSLQEGRTAKLVCTITPDNAAKKDVEWKSSNESIATVSEDGTVTAVSAGEAKITVTALDGSKCSAECTVKVSAAEE